MTYAEALDNLRNRPLFLSPNEYMDSLQTAMVALELAIRLEKAIKLIAGHSDYHGNTILSALYRIQEGKDVTQISPKERPIEVEFEEVL